MARRGWLCVVLACAVLSEALSAPHVVYRIRRQSKLDERNLQNAELEHSVHGADLSRKVRQDDGITTPSVINKDLDSKNEVNSPDPVDNDDDDDDFDEPMDVSNTGGGGGGSNIFSLLRLATSLFPGSSGGNLLIKNIIQEFLKQNQYRGESIRRQSIADNEIEIDETFDLKPPPIRQELDESHDNSESEASANESEHSEDSDSEDNKESKEKDDNTGAEESAEGSKEGPPNEKQDSESNDDDNDSDDDFDDPPEGDGEGGGLLGVLAGLSGGEDGSDLGTLLATVSGIVGNLSGGEGFDLNSLIGSAFGLFVGLLSEGEKNPGEVIASYLLTSLDSLTGGGAKNNGEFLGTFLSKLVKGTSAGIGSLSSSSGSSGQQGGSSQPASPFITLKLDIFRAVLQFATSLIGSASSSSSGAASPA